MTESAREIVVGAALPPTVQQSESAAIVSMIERAARDPAVDIEKFERLMAMRERVEKANAQRSFNVAMAAAQLEMPQVVRAAENRQTNSVYATLEAVGAAIDPVIAKHGFSLSFTMEEGAREGCVRIACILAHSDGFERRYFADVPTDMAGIKGLVNKTATHAFGSTVSYARRYLTMMIFNIKSRKATPDDDGDAASNSTPYDGPTHAETAHVEALIAETGSDLAKFLAAMKAPSIAELSSAQYDRGVALLNEKKRRMAETEK